MCMCAGVCNELMDGRLDVVVWYRVDVEWLLCAFVDCECGVDFGSHFVQLENQVSDGSIGFVALAGSLVVGLAWEWGGIVIFEEIWM